MARDERWRQVTVTVGILVALAVFFVLVAVAAHLPGLAGEFFARILGIVTTPFILETSLCILGFVVVLTLNQWRQIREGDELVYLDELGHGQADSAQSGGVPPYNGGDLKAAEKGSGESPG